jgi:hypothetical protein
MKNKSYQAIFFGENEGYLKQGEMYRVSKTQNENEVKIEFLELENNVLNHRSIYYCPATDFKEVVAIK